MAGIRVHELAKELGRPNREVIEALKANGVDVKSHMSRLEESHIRMIKEKFSQMGKEQIAKVENSRTEEKVIKRKMRHCFTTWAMARVFCSALCSADRRETDTERPTETMDNTHA